MQKIFRIIKKRHIKAETKRIKFTTDMTQTIVNPLNGSNVFLMIEKKNFVVLVHLDLSRLKTSWIFSIFNDRLCREKQPSEFCIRGVSMIQKPLSENFFLFRQVQGIF